MAKEPSAKKTRTTSYVPDESNANRHTEKGVKVLEKSLEQVGLGRSIVVDKNGIIIAGNLTQERAVDQGFDDAIEIETDGHQLVVVKRMDLDLLNDSDHRARKLAYLDNRASEVSLNWDPAQIKIDMDAGVNLSDIFDPIDLKKIVNRMEGSPRVEKTTSTRSHDELIEKWGVEEGAMWQIRSATTSRFHRIMCGDSRYDLPKLLGRSRADLVVTSPPYGVGKDYEAGGIEEWKALIHDVFNATKSVANMHFINLGDRKTNAEDIYELHTFGIMDAMLRAMGFGLLSLRVWTKDAAWSQAPYWRHSYKSVDDFEYLGLYATSKPKHVTRLNEDEMNEWGYRGVWSFRSVINNAVHSAQFPVELPLRAIRLFSDVDDLVLDPFGGRATTLVAAEQVGRTCYCMEKEPGYVAEALERMIDYQPTRMASEE